MATAEPRWCVYTAVRRLLTFTTDVSALLPATDDDSSACVPSAGAVALEAAKPFSGRLPGDVAEYIVARLATRAAGPAGVCAGMSGVECGDNVRRSSEDASADVFCRSGVGEASDAPSRVCKAAACGGNPAGVDAALAAVVYHSHSAALSGGTGSPFGSGDIQAVARQEAGSARVASSLGEGPNGGQGRRS